MHTIATRAESPAHDCQATAIGRGRKRLRDDSVIAVVTCGVRYADGAWQTEAEAIRPAHRVECGLASMSRVHARQRRSPDVDDLALAT